MSLRIKISPRVHLLCIVRIKLSKSYSLCDVCILQTVRLLYWTSSSSNISLHTHTIHSTYYMQTMKLLNFIMRCFYSHQNAPSIAKTLSRNIQIAISELLYNILSALLYLRLEYSSNWIRMHNKGIRSFFIGGATPPSYI